VVDRNDIRMYKDKINAAVEGNNVLDTTDLRIGTRKQGKVRDVYFTEKETILVCSDRVSGFDRILANIPFKGQVLTQVSKWWFDQTRAIVPNHIIAHPDPNVVVCKKCKVLPIEMVVRGFITGTTQTSMWVNYSKGVRDYCGHKLPEGLIENQRLDANIVTPTTKEDDHDRLIDPAHIISEGWMTKEQWDYCSKKALEIFAFGQKRALEQGLLLVDTKYEFGVDSSGTIMLIDEMHTPDSSRYWIASTYEERFENGLYPENIDKDIIRRWYKQNCDPYKDKTIPPCPNHLKAELSSRYIELYERITGKKFSFPTQASTQARILSNVKDYLSSKHANM